ncbi:MAG: type IV secretion system DNA-binding domain-containing protein [Verrucomicrobia bacterium]|nr:type IV secretion system DNA-binding domain-containing protein [Verrucomicrobiota bacterium]
MVQLWSPTGVAAGLVLGFALAGGALRWRRKKIATDHLRGRSLRTAREAQASLGSLVSSGDTGLQLGRLRIPSEAANSHLAIVGATGSGKTLLQRLLMQSALSRIGDGCGHRALIYDPKQDMVSTIAGMKLKCPVHLLNPLDARSVSWDMASDILSPASALQVASMLIPESRQDSNPFFAQAARHLIYGVLIAFIQSGKPWTFRQMLLLLRDADRLHQHLERTEATRFLLQYFEHPATLQNILSTLLAQLAPFEVIARPRPRSAWRSG